MADIAAADYYAIVPEWVLFSDVSAQSVRLYAVLRRYADKGTGVAHPSRKTLAAKLHVTDAKVIDRAVKELTAIGALVVTPRHVEGIQTSNSYFLPSRPLPSEGEGGGENATPRGAEKGDKPQSLKPQNNSSSDLDRADDRFEEFWRLYPKKEAKIKARDAWAKQTKTTAAQDIIDGLVAYHWDPDPKWRMQAPKWLNGRRWEDQQEAFNDVTQSMRKDGSAPQQGDNDYKPSWAVQVVNGHVKYRNAEEVTSPATRFSG